MSACQSLQTTSGELPPPPNRSSAAGPPSGATGGQSFGETWAERHVRRRDAARAWLARVGLTPQREQGEAATALPHWKVPGWTSLFDDFDLIALAEHQGMEADHG